MARLIPDSAVEKLKSDGFLRLELGDTAREAVMATFNAACPFFREPLERKILNRLPPEFGYRPVGVEYSQSPERPDPIEAFMVSARTRAEIAELRSERARTLYEEMLVAINVLEPIAEDLTIQAANMLGGSPLGEKLRGAFHRWSCLQVNYSRPSEVSADFIHETHEDGHLLTIACATGPGLEVQTQEGSFVPVTTAIGEAIIMPGDIAWLLSGGHVRPLYHRVRPAPNYHERMALLFFGDISPEYCEPWVRNEINRDVNISERVLTNATRFGLNGFALE
jgi:isopenicillin N synthase-like dioxygenase